MPFRMNKLDITVEVLSDDTEFDDNFREPQPGGRDYHSTTILDFAQFKNNKFEKYDFSDVDNNDFSSKSRIVISKLDWDYVKETLSIELKKGDLITKVGTIEMRMRIDEIRPTGIINGEHTLYFVMLVDHNVVLGGVY